ncbi:MAG: hypothetical protein GYA57_12605 [Myxococcales bacterium]|nr:hypothetical protein [Myxococcales bacterium]
MHRREILPGFVLAVLLARPVPARPGGFEYGVNGAEAVGRAGAFTARGANPSTLYYNPAGMGRIEPGTHLLLDANLVLRTLEFRRAGEMDFVGPNNYRVDGLRYPRVRDEGGVFPAPFFALVTDLGLDTDFQFGFGAFGPAAVGRASFPSQVWVVNHDDQRIPIPAPQRYDLLFMDVLFVWPTLAASWRILDDLVVGAAFQSGFVHIVFQNSTVAFGNGDDVVADIRANLDVWDPFVPAGMLGVWYRPCRFLELAVSARISDGIGADGEVVTISNPYGVRGQEPISSAEWSDYDTENGEHPPAARLSFPWPLLVLRTGVRFLWPRDTAAVAGGDLDAQVAWRLAALPPHEREWFDVELDVTYEMNSVVDSFRTKIDGVVPLGYGAPNVAVRPDREHPENAGVLELPHHWQDTVAVRLGGDVNLLEGAVSLHWGGSFETSTVPEDYTRLDYAQWMTFGVAGGVTVRLPWYGIDVTAAYLHYFSPDREITDGKVRMLSALPREEQQIPVINDGKFKMALDIFSVGLAARF